MGNFSCGIVSRSVLERNFRRLIFSAVDTAKRKADEVEEIPKKAW